MPVGDSCSASKKLCQRAVHHHDGRHRNADAGHAHAGQFRNRDQFGFHAGDAVHQVHREQPVDFPHRALDIGRGADAVDERHVGAGIEVEVGAANGFVQAVHGVGIGAGVDHRCRAQALAHIGHGADLAGHLLGAE